MVYKRVRGWNSGRSHWGRFEEKSSFLVLCPGAITNYVTSYKILKRLESHWTMPHHKTITNQQCLTATSRNTQENSMSSKKTARGQGRVKEQPIFFSPSSSHPLFFFPPHSLFLSSQHYLNAYMTRFIEVWNRRPLLMFAYSIGEHQQGSYVEVINFLRLICLEVTNSHINWIPVRQQDFGSTKNSITN